MARKPREEVAGGVHHVFARGNDRRKIFLDDADRLLYLRLLGTATSMLEWNCLAYCLMPNHVHLLIETPLPNLGQGMKGLQGRYTQAFNARHGRSGHVFQGRFGAERVKGDRQLTAVARYIEENPVKAGLCNRPRDWPWSAVNALYEGMSPTWLNDQRLQTLLGTVVG